ncbi:MAG: hypothetical protein DMF77_11395 [Acidobacteria bacterium]|nr:MAG: hypothetical protein DMF77_11395 [Acidobacteriota bacterium]
MSTLPSDYDVAEENRRARQLRMIVDLASSVIVQGGLRRGEAEALVAATRRRALELFPGKEDTRTCCPSRGPSGDTGRFFR